MNLYLLLACATITNILGFFLYEARRDLHATRQALDRMLFEEESRTALENEFAKRPVQAMIPRDAIEVLGQAIIQYLSHSLNGPMEVPIFSRDPEGPKT